MAAENPRYDTTLHPGPLFGVHTVRPRSGVVVVAAVGDIDMATAPRLHEALLDAARGPLDHLIVDLGAVTFLCGAGVRPLVAVRDAAAAGAFQLHLTGVSGNRPVAVVLDALHLTGQFTICSSVSAAVVATPSAPTTG